MHHKQYGETNEQYEARRTIERSMQWDAERAEEKRKAREREINSYQSRTSDDIPKGDYVPRRRTRLGKFVIKLGVVLILLSLALIYFNIQTPAIVGIDGNDAMLYGGVICLLSVYLSEVVGLACFGWAFWIVRDAGLTDLGFDFSVVGFDIWIGAGLIALMGIVIGRGLGKR
jgi:hypothetical protein